MYNHILDTLGVTHSFLQSAVVFGIIAVIVGVIFVLYWHFIVVGAMAVLCLVVLANGKPESVPTPSAPSVIEAPNAAEEPPPKKEKPLEEMDDRAMFMEDCLSMTDYTEAQCVDLWFKRDPEETPEPIGEST